MTSAFKDVDARVGTVLLTMETAFAFLFGVVVLKEHVRLVTVVGACCITGAVVSTAAQQLQPLTSTRSSVNRMAVVEMGSQDREPVGVEAGHGEHTSTAVE